MTRGIRSGTVVAAMSVLALLGAPVAPLVAQDASGGLIRGGAAPDLFLLYTGDVIGYLGPCG